MRFFIITFVFILLQLLSYGTGKWIQWLLKPYLTLTTIFKSLLILSFLVSNTLFIMLFFGHFKPVFLWLALLWLLCLSISLTWVIWFIGQRFTIPFWQHTIRAVSVILSIGLIGMAWFNAHSPVVRYQTIEIDKPLSQPLTLAVASDLHLGKWVGNTALNHLATILTQHHVDMLLMPGDIIDDDIAEFDAQGMARSFAQLTQVVPKGVYVTLGNHDLYHTASRTAIDRAIQDAGMILLNDQAVNVNNVWIVGRVDDHDQKRAETKQLLKGVNQNQPVILLDHRPTEIEKHQSLGIDLQVSGHTHNGQIFPANWIVHYFYPLTYGYKKFQEFNVIVSSGYGFWGVPFRLGSRSEVWIIRLQSTQTNPL